MTAGGKGAAFTCEGEAALIPVFGMPVEAEALKIPFQFTGATH
jgi:hypothetical protein